MSKSEKQLNEELDRLLANSPKVPSKTRWEDWDAEKDLMQIGMGHQCTDGVERAGADCLGHTLSE